MFVLIHLFIKIYILLGEKPFKCDQCLFATTQKNNLNDHKALHTGFSSLTNNLYYIYLKGEKSFKCEVCSLLFIKKSALRKHERIHTGLFFQED